MIQLAKKFPSCFLKQSKKFPTNSPGLGGDERLRDKNLSMRESEVQITIAIIFYHVTRLFINYESASASVLSLDTIIQLMNFVCRPMLLMLSMVNNIPLTNSFYKIKPTYDAFQMLSQIFFCNAGDLFVVGLENSIGWN